MSFIKRVAIITGFLALFLGFFVGTLCPAQYLPWKERETAMTPSVVNSIIVSAGSASASGSSSANTLPAFNSSDNFPLLSSACAVVRAIQERDYDTLAAFVHPEEGVTFTPYSTVDRDSDLRFTAAQVRQFSTDQTVYTWGVSDGLGSLIELTPAEYFSTYVFNTDYTQAPEIGVDRILQSGNALENLTEAYPGCRFVEFHFPGLDPANAGLDWCSLKLAAGRHHPQSVDDLVPFKTRPLQLRFGRGRIFLCLGPDTAGPHILLLFAVNLFQDVLRFGYHHRWQWKNGLQPGRPARQ